MAADEVTVGALKRLRLDVHQTDRTLKDLLDRVFQVRLRRNLQQKGVNGLHFTTRIMVSLFNNRMGRGVVGPGDIWGRVQGVGSDHWGTSSPP